MRMRCNAGGLDQGSRYDELGTVDLGSANTQKGPRVTSRELSFYGPLYIGGCDHFYRLFLSWL
jgi:hypothetical protein